MRKWSLGHLTVASARPHELVEIAARAGYDAVDPFVGLVQFPELPMVTLKAGDADTVRLAGALKANAIAFNTADAFLISEASDMEAVRRMVDLVAELGARNVNAILVGEDHARGLANLAALDAMARAAGMGTLVEFVSFSRIPTGRAALAAIAAIGSHNIGLMVDALHLSHGGEGPQDMQGFGAAIHGAQLCDAPAKLSDEEYYRRSLDDRMMPGDGELPMVDFMAALPAGLTCAIEVPWPGEPDLLKRASMALAAGKAVDRAG
jgi:sugar phosphate isomerase/epimerase